APVIPRRARGRAPAVHDLEEALLVLEHAVPLDREPRPELARARARRIGGVTPSAASTCSLPTGSFSASRDGGAGSSVPGSCTMRTWGCPAPPTQGAPPTCPTSAIFTRLASSSVLKLSTRDGRSSRETGSSALSLSPCCSRSQPRSFAASCGGFTRSTNCSSLTSAMAPRPRPAPAGARRQEKSGAEARARPAGAAALPALTAGLAARPLRLPLAPVNGFCHTLRELLGRKPRTGATQIGQGDLAQLGAGW
ncbi:MAG: hypothetical protein J3K34DRAFT_407570, partial [Monoraphidium minutum]